MKIKILLKKNFVLLKYRDKNNNIESIFDFIQNIQIQTARTVIDIDKLVSAISIPYCEETDNLEMPDKIWYKNKQMLFSQYDSNLFQFLVLVVFDRFDNLIEKEIYDYIYDDEEYYEDFWD